MKKAEEYLKYISDKIHHSIVATVDDEGLPVTSAIDMMDSDRNSLYFLTAKGKGFYHRLKARPFIALTGVKGNDTMSSVAISIRGKTEEAGECVLKRLIEANPYMFEIYPTEESRKALSSFRIYEGSGEYFDLSSKPIERKSFSFGKRNESMEFFITDGCTGCRKCIEVCPQSCINADTIPFTINSEHCLLCGNCISFCPENAVVRRVR